MCMAEVERKGKNVPQPPNPMKCISISFVVKFTKRVERIEIYKQQQQHQ